MKSTRSFFCFVTLVFTALLLPAQADGLNTDEVVFTGSVSSVIVNGEGVGTVFVRIQDFDLKVIVNSQAEVVDQEGEDISLEELGKDALLEIRGKFSASGVLASQVRLLEEPDTSFQLKGRITKIQSSGDDLLIGLLGIAVQVTTADTKIEQDGATLSPSSLKIGMMLSAAGTISGTTWTATSIKLASEQKKDKVTFEGTVSDMSGDKITVLVSGTTATTTPVAITSNTKVVGTLAKDAYVAVKGTLNPDLSVTALEIRVLHALEVKPEERKIKVAETATFTVKLRESAASAVVVTLISSDPDVVTVSSATVTIPAGSRAVDFTATGVKIGTAELSVKALGDAVAARVTVGRLSDEDDKVREVSIAFAPDHIKMSVNETREVVLLIKPPQRGGVTPSFESENNLVTVAAARDLGNGAASMKVWIEGGAKAGRDSVVATLPDSEGVKAELLVEISEGNGGGRNNEPLEIDFRPDGIKLGVGESRSVNLMLSRTMSQDVIVTLAGGGAVAGVDAQAVIPAGSKTVSVSVSGKEKGKTAITATLPDGVGADAASLAVEVR